MTKKMRKQLNRQQVFVLRSFKGEENGRHRYFEYLRDIYKDDPDTLADIDTMEEMQKGVDSVEAPAAHDKRSRCFMSSWTTSISPSVIQRKIRESKLDSS